jgi:hypothetical protein
MSEQAYETLLVDLLRSVPIDHRTEWEIQWAEDGTPTGHSIATIGKDCHEAADRIEELEAENKRLQAAEKEARDNPSGQSREMHEILGTWQEVSDE